MSITLLQTALRSCQVVLPVTRSISKDPYFIRLITSRAYKESPLRSRSRRSWTTSQPKPQTHPSHPVLSRLFQSHLGGIFTTRKSSKIPPRTQNAMICNKQHRRWRSTESERTSHSSKKTPKGGFTGFLGGVITSIGGGLLYVYHNAPDTKWIKVLRHLGDLIREYDENESTRVQILMSKEYQDLTASQELRESMNRLSTALARTTLPKQLDIHGLNIQLEECRTKVGDLKEQLTQITEERNTLSQDNGDLNAQLTNLQTQFNQEKQRTTTLEGKISTLERQAQKNENATIQALKNELTECRERKERLQRKLQLLSLCDTSQCTADLMKYFKATSELIFDHNTKFSPKYADLLSQAICENIHPEVTELDFYGTYIRTNKGLLKLLRGLKTNTSIKKVNIGWTSLSGNDEVTALIELIKANQTITDLRLYDNTLNDKDAIRIAKALRNNATLQKLYIRNTGLTTARNNWLKKQFPNRVIIS